MTCSNYEDCLFEIPEREREREREWEVVVGEKYSEHEGQQQRWEQKKYLKLLHNDFIHRGEHFQIEHKLAQLLSSSL